MEGGGPKVPTDLSGSRTLPRLHPRAPYPLRASLSTRTAMMINVPSFPNTQGHQDSPVVSLAFVGVPLPADPQAVQERATPLGACGSGRCRLRLRIFPRPPAGTPRRVHSSRASAKSSITGWVVKCSHATIHTRPGSKPAIVWLRSIGCEYVGGPRPRSAECRGISILHGWPRHRRYERTMHGAALRPEATLRCGDDVGPGLCSCTRTRFAAWSSPPPVKLVASRDGEMRDVGQVKVP